MGQHTLPGLAPPGKYFIPNCTDPLNRRYMKCPPPLKSKMSQVHAVFRKFCSKLPKSYVGPHLISFQQNFAKQESISIGYLPRSRGEGYGPGGGEQKAQKDNQGDTVTGGPGGRGVGMVFGKRV